MVAAAQERLERSKKNLQEHLGTGKVKWFRRHLGAWGDRHFRDFPWRRTKDPYAIFVAEFLLQQTNAAKVAPIYQTFVARYPTLGDLAAVPVEEVVSLLQPLGLFGRAERLRRSAQIVLEKYGGKFPRTEAELLELPGVGPYIARSVCAHAYGQPLAVLDTNVARILERFFGLEGGRVKWRSSLLWEAALAAAPKKQVGVWNLALLDFGAAVCTAKNPGCAECPLRSQCDWAAQQIRTPCP
ncbi:MAG: A/G-specific adenine glycosylase [Oscillatoria princeps RMCB-10]|nr:A/G-specific adenine glycosylase [Oscillatoria princeps RMCB-10]